MAATAILTATACILWFVMFSPWTAPCINFWGAMLASTVLLASAALFLDRSRIRARYTWKNEYLLIGVLSAVVLYGVFLAGDAVSRWILSFAGREIENIYATKAQASPAVIGLLLLFFIGPAEEIFWRGFIQARLETWFGRKSKVETADSSEASVRQASAWLRIQLSTEMKAYFAASILYALVHIWAFNLMLFGAALVCALFWGAMYARYRSVWPGLISHAVWDTAIFVLWPMG
ncbi:CPBP family intramembrane metalloprotease [bacterium]|nr:CPBP family intramembrane metalloprotease [bacterium]